MQSNTLYLLSLFTLSLGCLDTSSTTENVESGRHRLGPQQTRNRAGIAEAYSPLGTLAELEANNAFFKDMGTTGRTCESCHGLRGGWSASASQQLWDDSHGTDPLFMFTHDNGLCPDSDISTKHKRKRAMRLTLSRGSTRGNQTIQPTAEFELVSLSEPWGCTETSPTSFFTYRKPNPLTSVSQKSSVTWAPAPQPDMRAALKNFMIGATQNHGKTTYVPTDEEQSQGADFMFQNYFAQIEDEVAGRLDDDGGNGGPFHLAEQAWFPGINHSSTGTTTKRVFTLFDAWIDLDAENCHPRDRRKIARRKLIAEGQELFNERQNANGGTCSGCHNSPNVGTRSVYQLFDIGVVDIADPELPRVTIRNKTTGETRVVSNLGRAAATGLWSDVGRMSVPILRGLSSRAPYFHAGQARTLEDVVNHYDARFTFGFTDHERKALVAFLSAL